MQVLVALVVVDLRVSKENGEPLAHGVFRDLLVLRVQLVSANALALRLLPQRLLSGLPLPPMISPLPSLLLRKLPPQPPRRRLPLLMLSNNPNAPSTSI
jgi:hypothetical protein